MKVRDLMSPDVVTLHADSPMVDAEEVMGLRRMRHLPVVEGKKVVGLISHRDLLRHFASPAGQSSWIEQQVTKGRIKVREVMTGRVKTIRPDAMLVDAAAMLDDDQVGCLLVVDDAGDLVGILTEADFVKLARVLLQHTVGDDEAAQNLLDAWMASSRR